MARRRQSSERKSGGSAAKSKARSRMVRSSIAPALPSASPATAAAPASPDAASDWQAVASRLLGDGWLRTQQAARDTVAALTILPRLLQVNREDRRQMYREIDAGATLRSIPYWSFIVASCGIATLGLILNSAAVIIGAMLVSPLMAPILGLGLSLAVGDSYLSVKSLLTVLASVLVATLTAAVITMITPLNEVTAEIVARTNPSVLDLFVALFCGLVAAYSSVRSGGREALGSVAPGAAIGVALMPPLCVVGYGLGQGFHGAMMWGAFLLFLTNLLAIMLVSSGFYLLLYRGSSREEYMEMLDSERRNQSLFQHPLLGRLWAQGSQLNKRRFLLPLLLLLAIAYPLTSSLLILKQKNDVRRIVEQELRGSENVQLLRGVEALSFDGKQVSGQIVFAGPLQAGELEDRVRARLQDRFPEMDVGIRFQRVAGETDMATIRSLAAWREAAGSALYDPAAEEKAQQAARMLLDYIGARFPPGSGALVGLELQADSASGVRVQLRYMGDAMPDSARNAVADTLLSALRASGSQLAGIELERGGAGAGAAGCQDDRALALEESRRLLAQLEAAARRNPTLNIEVALHSELYEESAQRTPLRGLRRSLAPDQNCVLRYRLL